ncbi:MAG: hypothetical protein ABSA59_06995 [Terriglobia bacterium]|jgi:hypothetical protein
MAGDLGWKSVELQIETLIPGILLTVETKAIAQDWNWVRVSPIMKLHLLGNDLIRGAFFVAVAYAFGLVSSVVARAVVDGISERGPRACVFRRFAHATISALVRGRHKHDPDSFPKDYAEEKRRRCLLAAAAWNATYRSALRTTSRRDEVDRRRAQGRFVRNLFFVFLLAPRVLTNKLVVAIVLAFLAAVIGVVLYAYSEYVNFAEAYDISAQQSPPAAG